MHCLSLNQLLIAIGDQWLAPPAGTVQGDRVLTGRVVIDSREVEPGDIFWALPGEQRDGADFIADAFTRGASGVVTSRTPIEPPEGCWAVFVRDPKQALQHVAAWQRRQFTGKIVAVTGSVGKTTTRAMIDTLLASRYYGAASPKNYNNELGVPLSMLAWESDHQYAVLELGANHCGEIARLARLSQPHIGVITRIGEAHLGGFGSREAIAHAKAELLDALPYDGLAVLNADDPQLRRTAHRSAAKIVWFGRSANADVSATHVRSSGGQLQFRVEGCDFEVPVWGRHYLTSALAAVAVGRAFDLTLAEMADALAEFRSPPMRCQVTPLRGATIINDCYNSNPTAMRAALELLRDFDSPGRRIVVCGDMKELGTETTKLHRAVGDEMVTVCGADLLVACGEHAAEVLAGARAAGMTYQTTMACPGPEEAATQVGRFLRANDVVLVKGSRAAGLERCIAALERGEDNWLAVRRAA
jgi:UDP-N-acetylmuramoyl-tripeptide--D-alanyl-D-alanine ligase